MKASLTAIAIVVTVVSAGASAETVPPQQVLEFSPAPAAAGDWSYNGAGVLSFDQDIIISSGLGSNYDALVGAHVYLPTFQVAGIPDAPYVLTPLGSAQIVIKSADNSVTYLTGALGSGDLSTIGTVAGGFTQFQMDITDLFITHEGSALGSAALALLENLRLPSLRFRAFSSRWKRPGLLQLRPDARRRPQRQRRVQWGHVGPRTDDHRPARSRQPGLGAKAP